jgi:hypothetical protein
MRDAIISLDVVEALPKGTITANTNGTAVDLLGCNAVGFTVFVDNTGDTLTTANKFTASFEEADDNGSGAPGTWSAVPAAKVTGDTAVVAKHAKYEVGCLSLKRWVRLVLTAVGTHTSGNGISAVAVRNRLQSEGKGW